MGLAFVLSLTRLLLHFSLGLNMDDALNKTLAIVCILAMFVFLICALVLWIEGLIDSFALIKQRLFLWGILRIIFLLFGTFFAAYVLHFVKMIRRPKEVTH